MKKYKTQATKSKLSFLFTFNEHINEVQISHLEAFKMFRNRLLELLGSSFRLRPNTQMFFSPNVRWQNVET